MAKYIVLNIEGEKTFNELKKLSGVDFSRNDARFVKFWDDYILPYRLMELESFKEFRTFLEEGGYLDNLTTREISHKELEDYQYFLEWGEMPS